MLDESHLMFQVTDLKQYVYCPRIFYYQTVLPAVRPTTYKMEEGIAAHHSAESLEQRRSLRPYGLKTGQRHFNLALHDPTLKLSGELDMLIETETELIPVDYKLAPREGAHYRLQLLAYARLLEQQHNPAGKSVRRGFLYLIPLRRAVEVAFTPALRRQLETTLQTMCQIAQRQYMPALTTQPTRCVDCEFRRFCNDVL